MSSRLPVELTERGRRQVRRLHGRLKWSSGDRCGVLYRQALQAYPNQRSRLRPGPEMQDDGGRDLVVLRAEGPAFPIVMAVGPLIFRFWRIAFALLPRRIAVERLQRSKVGQRPSADLESLHPIIRLCRHESPSQTTACHNGDCHRPPLVLRCWGSRHKALWRGSVGHSSR